ncbi:MAG: HAD-IC family P-type ATPase [Gemmatimonadota bacterium]
MEAKTAGTRGEAPVRAWHAAPPEAVLRELDAPAGGLSPVEAKRRLEVLGPNALPRAARESPWALVLRQVNTPLIYVLLAAAGVALAMGKTVDGIVVLGVVVLNTLIGFVQEMRAGRAIEALIDMVPETATVLRMGERSVVPATQLVPGDVVELKSGDKVPADVRLLAVRSLRVEEAALTGESVPTAKSVEALAEGAPLGDRVNMAYGGTLVTYGTGTGVVVATGAGTELGRISAMLRETTHLETPLTRQLAVVGKWLTVGILATAALLMAVGMWRGYPLMDALLAAITMAVGAIPEGLPAIVTIALAIGVQRMARRRAVIRRLPACETLGSTTVICSDKTGTLTRNEMTVKEAWTPRGAFRVSGVGYAPHGEFTRADGGGAAWKLPGDAQELMRAGALCSDAALHEEDGTWRVDGDPTEGALVVAARKAGLDVEALRREWPRLDAVPFESERQFMATLHAGPDGSRVVYLKGAPEVVVARCAFPGGEEDARAVLREVERMASAGMRVLAFAAGPAAGRDELDEADVEDGFVFLGLQGMIDPPRPEAMRAIAACHRAGITVKMITGDHRTTAAAIGRELGLLSPVGEAMAGEELAALSDAELAEVVRRVNVFARVAPEHKLRLVRALQAQGEVVAMTGDGVNDAPALRQADIGVAMGITGTAVSKESADMVLVDDNFASIAAAVEEGRRVYDNLIKSLAFVLPTNLGLAVILLAAVAFFPMAGGDPLLPMTPTQILWINLVATVALALPLALEAMEPDVMRRAPRRPDAPVLGGFVVARTVAVALLMAAGALGLFLYEYGLETGRGVPAEVALREAQTMAVTTVILFQVFYLLNCRSLRDSVLRIGLWSNPAVYLGIAALLALQAAFVYLPFMNAVFGTAPLNADALLKSVAVASTVLFAISLEKWWRSATATAPRGRGMARLGR